MKKMRYASEFFASLFEPKRAKTFSRAMNGSLDLPVCRIYSVTRMIVP